MKKRVLLYILLMTTFLHASKPLTSIVPAPLKTVKAHTNALYVQLDIPTLLDSNEKSILIHLNSTTDITLNLKKIKNKKDKMNFSYVGENKKDKIKAILSIRNNILAGTIKVNNDTYKIIPVGNVYKIEKLDRSKIMPFHDDIVSEEAKKPIPEMTLGIEEEKLIAEQAAASGDTIIDVMLLYTAAFKLEHGTSTEAVMQNLFDIMQNAFIDSLTEVNFNLVHIAQVPTNSSLNDTSDLSIAITDLSSDGYTQHLRTQYGADIVSLIGQFAETSTYCGRGWMPTSTDSSMTNAFAVLLNGSNSQGYYCSDITLAHEVGHNFACAHDSDHASSAPMYSYAYGYDIVNKFATIMSYDTPGINYFSNPSINDDTDNLPIGDASSADNARTIRENKLKIADNSSEIDESLEVDDVQDGLEINAYLTSNTDRDTYTVNLGGTTTFTADNVGYNCWYFYINLYDENYNLVFSSDADSGTGCSSTAQVTLENGTYKMMVYKNNWLGDDTYHYLIDIETSYETPKKIFPSIISYLLY